MKFLKLIGRILSFVGITVIVLVATLGLMIVLICHGPSESAKELFATTILETGQVKFLASWFLSKDEISNKLQELKNEFPERFEGASDSDIKFQYSKEAHHIANLLNAVGNDYIELLEDYIKLKKNGLK